MGNKLSNQDVHLPVDNTNARIAEQNKKLVSSIIAIAVIGSIIGGIIVVIMMVSKRDKHVE